MHIVLFASSDHSRSVTFNTGAIVKVVGLQLTENWLNNQLNKGARKMVEKAAAAAIDVQLTHIMQNDVSRLVNEIFELEQFHPAFRNTQENRLFILCENFFKSLEE